MKVSFEIYKIVRVMEEKRRVQEETSWKEYVYPRFELGDKVWLSEEGHVTNNKRQYEVELRNNEVNSPCMHRKWPSSHFSHLFLSDFSFFCLSIAPFSLWLCFLLFLLFWLYDKDNLTCSKWFLLEKDKNIWVITS